MNEQERDRLIEIERQIKKFAGQRVVAQPNLFRMVVGALDKDMGKNTRLEWLRRLSGNSSLQSSNDLPEHLKFGLLMWANPYFDECSGKWAFSKEFHRDCFIILKSLGQLSFVD